MPDMGDRVKIIKGGFKGEHGTIVSEYHGWNFVMYTIRFDDLLECTKYYNEIEVI